MSAHQALEAGWLEHGTGVRDSHSSGRHSTQLRSFVSKNFLRYMKLQFNLFFGRVSRSRSNNWPPTVVVPIIVVR